ncbi:hypothetical protein [Halomicrococcus gelatinilyticus]|uniref:hypothetical protein n=1 Tax=Halomicrococcus gelatinilyticus TaxID=1702103 RepID=UPI002E0E150A
MNALRDRIEDFRSSVSIEPDDLVTAITGVSASTAEKYAAPDERPESYYGRDTSVETVAELVCSDATLDAVPSGYRWSAIRDLLAVSLTVDDAEETVERHRDADGGLARLFGEAIDEFDPSGLTIDDLRIVRFYTAFGTSVSMGRAGVFVPLYHAPATDWVEAYHSTYQQCWRGGAHEHGFDAGAMQEATVVSDVMEMHKRDEVVLTPGTDPSTLQTTDAVRSATATAVPVKGFVAASLLLGVNFADFEAPGTVRIRGYEEPEPESEKPYCVFVPPEGEVRHGLVDNTGGGQLSASSVSEAVRNYLI